MAKRTYAVFYTKDMSASRQYGDGGLDDQDTRHMPRPEFDRLYRYVGTFEATHIDVLYGLLNDGIPEVPNPLGDPQLQDLVISGVGHTSMSVGDIAVDLETHKLWICASMGWRELELV